MAQVHALTLRAAAASHRRRSRILETVFWYVVLSIVAAATVFPFVWIFLTSFKGATDPIYSMPPQFIPRSPTLDNYVRVWNQLPVGNFFVNSIVVATTTTVASALVSALAAYPLAKMKFRGRDTIFYALLATYIVPAQLTYIPGFVLAQNVFHYYDSILALIFPNIAGAFNIFMLRQALKSVPNDLIDAAKIDGASELRIWWQILLPVIRPTLATLAIITFAIQWNDFLWPLLMLHTRENMTLQVGLATLQGTFTSDFRATAAGVTLTVVPILVFFVTLQKYFVRGLTGAVKG